MGARLYRLFNASNACVRLSAVYLKVFLNKFHRICKIFFTCY